jgi:hypothetical protein
MQYQRIGKVIINIDRVDIDYIRRLNNEIHIITNDKGTLKSSYEDNDTAQKVLEESMKTLNPRIFIIDEEFAECEDTK